MKKIEFLFFSGCPNSEPTYNNLLEALKELNLSINVEKIDVETLEKANEVNFLGSPSIYIDGVDIYTMQKPKEVNYACRTFDIGGKKSGVIPKEFIKDRLKSFI
ncbi:MAG: DF family (seleno)protein [Desulfurella sp.]|uniref:DF family (seleno)protein n=1 Tax=Desulfurella sp. TaxID=1962857 RepID=UPI003D0C1A59